MFENLEEIENETHREIVYIMRTLIKEYGASGSLKNAIRIKKWCERKCGDKPREERRLPSSKSKDSKEREIGKMFHICCSKEMSAYDEKALETEFDER